MDFKNMPEERQKEFSNLMFAKLSSPEELKDWIKLFFGLDIPIEISDPDSSCSPITAMWYIYESFLTNAPGRPGAIMLSCREGAKTLSVSILELILLLHFKLDIGHASSVESQSAVALSYIEGFLMAIQPLLDLAGWENISQNKRLLKFRTPDGKFPFLKVLIASTKGFNSLHSNLLFIDELDLADPKALKEAKNIVSFSKGIHGMTVYLSTRKFAFGNMASAINNVDEMGWKMLRWNIIDMTEACPPSRHKPELPRETRYIRKSLPLKQLNEEEYSLVTAADKINYEVIKDAPAGCVDCPLLPVCKTRLKDKPVTATGSLYKPISSVIQKFKENDPDTAEAQLMCFSEEAQILMGDGVMKPIKDVQVGDTVISHTGMERRVTEVFSRSFVGRVMVSPEVNLKNFSKSFVTTEHPYFVNGLHFQSIENVRLSAFDQYGEPKTVGDYLSLPSGHSGHNTVVESSDFIPEKMILGHDETDPLEYKYRNVPRQFMLTKDFGWIIGFYLSCGSATRKTGEGLEELSCVDFQSNIGDRQNQNKIRRFAESLGLKTTEKQEGSKLNQVIYSVALCEIFSAFCGPKSDKKRIHKYLMNANKDFLRGVWRGFNDSGKDRYFKPYHELVVNSYDLACQLFLIAAKLCFGPRITKSPDLKYGKEQYLVHYINTNYVNGKKLTKFITKGNYSQYRMDSRVSAQYSGLVFNLEVELDHSYIANGVAVHNCWKPGSEGLIYPRFSPELNKGNVIDYKTAYEKLTGEKTNKSHVSEHTLLYELKKAQIPFYAGVDWGYSHDFVIIIVAILPDGDVWLMETFASPGLEFVDQLEIGKNFRDKYQPSMWYADTAMPSHLKSFTKNGMKCAKFTKDVLGGIEAIRSKISTSSGQRLFKILYREENKRVISALNKHRFLLDGQGNPTMTPDNDRGIADICDALRYIGQNRFPVKGTQKLTSVFMDGADMASIKSQNPTATEQMRQEIASRISGGDSFQGGTGKKGGIIWDI